MLSFVRSLVHSLTCSLVCSFARSIFRCTFTLFAHSFARSFVYSSVRSLALSFFVHSFTRYPGWLTSPNHLQNYLTANSTDNSNSSSSLTHCIVSTSSLRTSLQSPVTTRWTDRRVSSCPLGLATRRGHKRLSGQEFCNTGDDPDVCATFAHSPHKQTINNHMSIDFLIFTSCLSLSGLFFFTWNWLWIYNDRCPGRTPKLIYNDRLPGRSPRFS